MKLSTLHAVKNNDRTDETRKKSGENRQTTKAYVCCAIGEKPVVIQVKRDASFIQQSVELLERHMQAVRGFAETRGDGERATPLWNIETGEVSN